MYAIPVTACLYGQPYFWLLVTGEKRWRLQKWGEKLWLQQMWKYSKLLAKQPTLFGESNNGELYQSQFQVEKQSVGGLLSFRVAIQPSLPGIAPVCACCIGLVTDILLYLLPYFTIKSVLTSTLNIFMIIISN